MIYHNGYEQSRATDYPCPKCTTPMVYLESRRKELECPDCGKIVTTDPGD